MNKRLGSSLILVVGLWLSAGGVSAESENEKPQDVGHSDACFELHELMCDTMLVPDWRTFARGIPKEQLEELLTSADLGSIDATLAAEAQFGWFRGYRPFLSLFFQYVLQQRSHWYNEAEFAELLLRLNSPALKAWKRLKLVSAHKSDEG